MELDNILYLANLMPDIKIHVINCIPMYYEYITKDSVASVCRNSDGIDR